MCTYNTTTHDNDERERAVVCVGPASQAGRCRKTRLCARKIRGSAAHVV